MGNKSTHISERCGIWLSISFAIAVFLSKIGLKALDPQQLQWLRTSSSDWAPDQVAWMFFRKADWSFPIGLFHGYSFPETVSIGLTGAIPLLAVPLKLLDGILPNEFQYFGIWLLVCFILQAFFSYKLLQSIGVQDPIVKFLGTCLYVLSYSFLDRIGHMNLCGHWLVLAALYGYFQWQQPRRALLYHALLVSASVWVHPYFILFNLIIGGAAFVNFYRQKLISFWKIPLFSLLLILAGVGAWILLGNHHLDSDQAIAEGFGIYSANLNTFITPKIDTTLMGANKRVYDGQFEGTAYLGLGILMMVFIIPFLMLKKKLVLKWSRNYNVIVLAAIVLFMYAVTNRITLNNRVLLEIPLPLIIEEKLSIFRASGRYVWLLQYLLITGFVAMISISRLASKWKYGMLALAILVNIVDFHDLIKRNQYIAEDHHSIDNFDDDLWSSIICNANRLRMYPSYQASYNKYGDQMEFAYIAGICGKDINAGHLARFDSKLRDEFRINLQDSVLSQPLVSDLQNYTFITTEKYLPDYSLMMEVGNHELFLINNYYVFIPKSQTSVISSLQEFGEQEEKHINKEEFEAFAKRNRNNTLLIAVRDEASKQLPSCEDFQKWIKKRGSKLVELGYRESYAGIFGVSQNVLERRGEKSGKLVTVQIDTTLQFVAEGDKIEKNIELFSAGNDIGNKASIFVEGIDYSKNNRGLNIVVLDPSGQVVESTSFDTYLSCHHFSEQSKLFFELWKIN